MPADDPSATPNPDPVLSDGPTVAAIAALVYAGGAVVHELIGHGLGCLASGGSTISWSSVHFDCSVASPAVMIGGTLANLVAGSVSFLLLRAARGASAATRYLLWLAMTVNLMQAAGYFLFSGAVGIGDWAQVLRHYGLGGSARAVMAIGGGLAYLPLVAWAARELAPLLPADRAAARRAARRLTLVPWTAGGLLSCLAGALNPVGILLVAISAGAASFGGTSGLAWMAWIVATPWAPLPPTAAGLPFARHRGYLVAGILVSILFVVMLGPGSGGR